MWTYNEAFSFAAGISGACDGDRCGVNNGFHGYFAHDIIVFEPKHKFEYDRGRDSEYYALQEFVGADVCGFWT